MVLGALAVTAGCAVSTPPRVYTVQAASVVPQRLGFDPAAPEDSPEPARFAEFRRQLGSALAARGIVIDPASPNRMVIALSERPASVGIGQNGAGNQLAAPRRHHFYDSCRAQRFDAALILRDAVSGAVTARWHGGVDACAINDAAIADLADQFARELTRH
jgi:hypothetical protein